MATNLVFFGNEKLATGPADHSPTIQDALRQAGYHIEASITGDLTDLEPHKSELAVLTAYGRLLPQSVLDDFPLGIINIHPSLLPLYRGPTPIEQAILDGVGQTGVSIMKITAKMDSGPIYGQATLELTGVESKADLAQSLQKLGADLLIELLPNIIAGTAQPIPQNDAKATYCAKIIKADGLVDWYKSANQLEREVRAYLGWPGSQTKLNGQDVLITAAKIGYAHGPVGQPFKNEAGELAVYCGQHALIILKLKPAGKAEMTGQAYLAGHPLV